MGNKNYTFLTKTEFIYFAKHYNEVLEAVYDYIVEDRHDPDTALIDICGISMDIDNKEVIVDYMYNYDEYIAQIDIPFEYFDKL